MPTKRTLDSSPILGPTTTSTPGARLKTPDNDSSFLATPATPSSPKRIRRTVIPVTPDSPSPDLKPLLVTPPSTTLFLEQQTLVPSTPVSSTPSKSSAPLPTTKLSPAALKKQSLINQLGTSPYPTFLRPTPEECQNIHDLLSSSHGTPSRPLIIVDRKNAAAGCGQTPSVLDALVRTVLSQNTSSSNSTKAKDGMDAQYDREGEGGIGGYYKRILEGGEKQLEEAIRRGGLAAVKSRAIVGVLKRIREKVGEEGELSLEWLRDLSDEDAMKELVSYDLVGVKTASCVLLFCLGRESFAVDTHVLRLSTSLGWLPTTSPLPTRDQAFFHLDALIPPPLKYGLHSLLVRHGRGCKDCAANGVTTMDFVDSCVIKDLVKRTKGKGGGVKKGGKKGGKVKKEVDEVMEEVVEVEMKKEVKDGKWDEEVAAMGGRTTRSMRSASKLPKGAMHGLDE